MMTPDEFLTTQLHLKLSHGISPEAYQAMTRELDEVEGSTSDENAA